MKQADSSHGKKRNLLFLTIIMLQTICCLSGCTVGPDYSPPDISSVIKINPISYPEFRYEQTDLSHWWDVFADPLLSELIEMGERNNLNRKIALSRVREARAVLGIENSYLYPQLYGNGDIAWGKDSESVNPLATGTETKYSFSADSGWEIDLFGRIRRSTEAATADYQASWEAHNNILISIRAEIAANYLNIRSLQAQLKTAEKNILSQRNMLKLTRIRYENGISTYLDVTQAGRVLANTEADLPVIRMNLNQAITALSVLTTEMTDSLRPRFEKVTLVPLPSEAITVGIPAERIRQRPDIKEAERLLAAQTARVGVATADLYPSFSLTGTLGLAALSSGDLADSKSLFYGIGPSLHWNLFNMGRVRQNIEVQDARTEQALYNYELTVLRAIKEAEDSLSGYHEQRLRLQALISAVTASQETLNMSIKLYKDGLTPFQDVLDAQRSLLQAESSRDRTRGDSAIWLVNIYKALAGGWITEQPKDQHLTN